MILQRVGIWIRWMIVCLLMRHGYLSPLEYQSQGVFLAYKLERINQGRDVSNMTMADAFMDVGKEFCEGLMRGLSGEYKSTPEDREWFLNWAARSVERNFPEPDDDE